MGILNKYLIIINIIGFVLYLINNLLQNPINKNINNLLSIICILGGAPGVFCIYLIIYIIKSEKPNKSNMMLIITMLCSLIIGIITYLFFIKNAKSNINFNIINYILTKKYFLIYLILINIIGFTIFALDKLYAIKKLRRISIITLLVIALLGGTIGEYISMHIFHHKTKKNYFSIGIPMIFIMHVILLIYIINC